MKLAIFLRCAAFVKALIVMAAMSVQSALAIENKPVTNALLMIGQGRFQDSLAILEELGANGDADALLELRDLHADGHFLPVDWAKAQHYFDLAVVTGDKRALWMQAYFNGDVAGLRKLYDQGFQLAACELSRIDTSLDSACYSGIKKNASEGFRHSIFALEAYRQDAEAEALRKQYPFVRVEAELAAIEWANAPNSDALKTLIRSIEMGSVKAAVDIVRVYSMGDDEKNRQRDKHLLGLDAETRAYVAEILRSLIDGDRRNWFNSDWSMNSALGDVFQAGHQGLGIESDFNLAFVARENCSRSTQADFAHLCFFAMADLKRRGGPNLLRNPEEAVALFRRAHDLGSSAASNELAGIYRSGGPGIPVDYEQAANFALVAIERGNNHAAYAAAMQFKQGLGVERDLDKAANLFLLAATEAGDGDPNAMIELAALHEKGGFSGANLNEALSWYQTAAEKSDLAGNVASILDVQSRAAEGQRRVSQTIDDIESKKASPKTAAASPIDFGRYVVLIVANQSYENLTELSTPRADAAMIGQALTSRFDAEVEYLFDATRIDLLSALNKYRRELMPTDNFILYYAGHGIYDEELNVGYWQPVDSTADDDYTWIETDRISRTLSGFKSRNALVIADSCYSGSVVRGGDSPIVKTSDTTALLALSTKKTRMAVTSGGLQPVLDATGNSKTSAFASNLADTLSSIEEATTISAIFTELRTAVTAETAAWGFEQIPELAPLYKAGHDGGDFILSPSN